MRSYKILEHTADVRLKAEGDSPEELFAAAVEGMAEIISGEPCKGCALNMNKKIILVSPGLTALLVDFLSEVLTRTHIERIIFCGAKITEVSESADGAKISATVYGRKVDEFHEDIKAVTYHEADVKRDKNGNWSTVIVFDI